MALNRLIVMGRLVKDCELRYTPAGKAVASMTLACDRDYKDKETGEKQTDYVDCVIWGTTAEFAANHFKKGQNTVAEGRLQFRDWKDKDGNNRRSAEMKVDNIYFAGPKPDGSSGSYSYDGRREEKFKRLASDVEGKFSVLDEDGELPF